MEGESREVAELCAGVEREREKREVRLLEAEEAAERERAPLDDYRNNSEALTCLMNLASRIAPSHPN
jgi:hypothetical protein